jgi:hypothetical protein
LCGSASRLGEPARDGGEPGGRGVDERMLAHPADLAMPGSSPWVGGQRAGPLEVLGKAVRPGEVVGSASGNHSQRYPGLACGIGGNADRAVPTGNHQPVGTCGERAGPVQLAEGDQLDPGIAPLE